MRVVAVLAVVVTLGFGLGAGQAFRSASGALERAGADAAQVVRVQDIHTNLVRADAAATNAFLVGGPGAGRPARRPTTRRSTDASAADRPGGAAPSRPTATRWPPLNADLVRYTGRVEQARANNRQGLPVGAQYLTEASAGLRAAGGALPQLDALVARQRRPGAAGARRGQAGAALAGAPRPARPRRARRRRWSGWRGAPTATSTSRWPERPSPSWSAWSPAGWSWPASPARVDEVRTGPYAAALATAQARVAGFDAKAQESPHADQARVRRRASRRQWQAARTQVRDGSAERAGAHRAPTCGGRTTPGRTRRCAGSTTAASGSRRWPPRRHREAPARPARPDRSRPSTRRRTTCSCRPAARPSARLAAPGGWLVLAGALGLLLGLLAAAASWWGVSQRLQEYR